MRRRLNRSIALSAALIVAGVATATGGAAAQIGSGYKLAGKVVVGGDGFWDYLEVDSNSHHVFVSRGTHVMVLDADGKVIGDIPNTPGIHGIALASEFNKGFTSNGSSATVTIFDMKTFQTLGTAQTDRGPDAIIYDPASKRVFTMNGAARSATAIDAASGAVAGSISLGGRPEFAAADGRGHVFANLEDKSEIIEIDSKALNVVNAWPLAPCASPSGLAIDAAHERLVVGCHNHLMAFIDGTNGNIVGTVPIGSGVDANRFDPATGLAFASCGDGTITVAHEDSPDKFSVVDTIQTQSGARTMAIDYSSHAVYTVTAEFEMSSPEATSSATGGQNAPPSRPRLQIVPGSFNLLIFKRSL